MSKARAPADTSPISPQPVVRYRGPPPVATIGVALSALGAIVEIAWWKDAGYEPQSIYRFFTAGAPFWWSLGLSLTGSALTWAYWRNGDRSKWWGLPGVLMASMWLLRITLGLVLLAIGWVWNQFGMDIVDASLPEKKRRPRKRRQRNSYKSKRRKSRRGYTGGRSRRRGGNRSRRSRRRR